MGFTLIWIETMAAALLLVAGVTAHYARRPQRRTQVRWPIVAAALILLGAVAKTVGVSLLVSSLIVSTGWFVYMLSWTLVYAAAASVLLVRGLKTGEDGVPQARGWSVGRLAVADAAALALALITFWNIDLTAKTRLAALRAEVGALALSAAPARVPDRQNAALVYQKAFDVMAKPQDQPPEVQEKWARWLEVKPDQPLDLKDPELLKYLDRNQPALAILRRAAAMPDCYFEHNYAQPSFTELLPEVSQMQAAARLTVLDARRRVSQQDARGALEDVNCLFAMSAHTRSSPLIVSVLVAANTSGMAAQALEETLASTQPKAEDLAVLTIEQDAPYQRSMARAFRMEEAFVLGFFSTATGDPEALSEVNAAPSYAMEPYASVWRVFLLPDDIASYRRAMQHYAKWTARPYGEAHADLEKWEQEFRSKEAGLFTRALVPALSGAAKRAAEADARHQLACTALAVEKCRAKTGKAPARLDALVPGYLDAVPADPFDGKPLRMTTAPSGIVLYSVGPDLKDEGGAPWSDEKRSGDILFRLPAR